MISLYHDVCHKCSELITRQYSTSFYSAIRLLHKDLRRPVHDIYGFVRLADEIVDTFHEHNKRELLDNFIQETWSAINNGISLNPILHSFQYAVKKYNIPYEHITAFLHSMALDLHKSAYDVSEINTYIYGSAEAVGLMCLCIFCEGNTSQFNQLKASACRLGAAFQKVNFLRDMKADTEVLNRNYFPQVTNGIFNASVKHLIEQEIERDFKNSLTGIRQLPWKARFGVYTAYRYYYTLFKKIKLMQASTILQERIRVPDYQKIFIVMQAGMYNRLNLI